MCCHRSRRLYCRFSETWNHLSQRCCSLWFDKWYHSARESGFALGHWSPEFDTKRRKLLIYIESALNLPLQQGHLSVLDRFFDVQCLQHFGLCLVDGRDPCDGLCLVDSHRM